MTKKELVKIIQEVVRKEVKKEVQKIFIKEETSPLLQDAVVKKPKPKKNHSGTKSWVNQQSWKRIFYKNSYQKLSWRRQ